MDTEAIIDAAAGKQALLSAALNAKNTAASHELVARVYEKLHEIMSILEEDQKVQEVKGLLDAQPWEELAGETMETKTSLSYAEQAVMQHHMPLAALIPPYNLLF
ncbi:hypothetical protein LTR56_017884 [Elasticomyces elasticus]|nr:hypothetical protein LTR56_017884 [Elasticomyces elasticus]KAK3637136.1 hypothetical protein LTR22_018392 [Elasticomyces elasticus]